jgi:predicted lipoprotein with Yx(FWY)xxD motif
MVRRSPFLIALTAVAIGAAACTPAATTPTLVPATTAPVTAAPASVAPTTAGGSGATVNATAVGTAGTILVDGASGMTLYVFAKDVKDSGKSNCTGGCLDTWPALTVAAGASPTGGTGVTGTLATITREDNGALQVTYNGLPLYFFKNDKAPGDLNGVYENWATVKP